MQTFAVLADIAMGVILGVFLYVAAGRMWPSAAHPVVAVLVVGASIALVLFRRPNGSLARRRKARVDR
jgi:ABC-type branched-subunit amino acid transport system permease subunit